MKVFNQLLKKLEHDELNCIIVVCPTEELADQLFEVFRAAGVVWNGTNDLLYSHWDMHDHRTIYIIRYRRQRFHPHETKHVLTRGSINVIPSIQIQENIEKCEIIHALAVISN
jgi:hypothetical protein